jgi:biotin synthase
MLNAIKIQPETRTGLRHDWTREEALALFALPFADLLFQAQCVHREHFNPNEVQVSTLLSIKTGGCAEDCAYCPQSARYNTGVKAQKLMAVEDVLCEARKAKQAGASRFCMGAAWREPKDRDMPKLTAMVEGVKALGLETCMTLGMLEEHQARELKASGLDYYNHNLDTSEEFYGEIITTRTYQDRLDTLEKVRNVGMKTCCGGIVGMGESVEDRAGMLVTLATLPEHPQSVPINLLVKVEGTPLAGSKSQVVSGKENGLVSPSSPERGEATASSASKQASREATAIDFIRTIAVARILMPASHVRLSAGREEMSDATQALCFLAGANSIFYGEKLLTTPNPAANSDMQLFERLGISAV